MRHTFLSSQRHVDSALVKLHTQRLARGVHMRQVAASPQTVIWRQHRRPATGGHGLRCGHADGMQATALDHTENAVTRFVGCGPYRLPSNDADFWTLTDLLTACGPSWHAHGTHLLMVKDFAQS